MRLALLIALLPTSAVASDFQPRGELGLRWTPTKSIRIYLDQHLHFDEDLPGPSGGFEDSQYAQHDLATEVAVRWRVHRLFRLKAGYRYIAEVIESAEAPYLDSYHRFFADVRVRYRTGMVVLRYRLRLQEQFGKPWERGEWRFTHTIRNRIGVQLRTELGARPFLDVELYARINDADGVLHKWKLTPGLDWQLGDHVVTLFYRFEDMLNDPANPNRHILGLGYHYEL